jgi:hypothetical protein
LLRGQQNKVFKMTQTQRTVEAREMFDIRIQSIRKVPSGDRVTPVNAAAERGRNRTPLTIIGSKIMYIAHVLRRNAIFS